MGFYFGSSLQPFLKIGTSRSIFQSVENSLDFKNLMKSFCHPKIRTSDVSTKNSAGKSSIPEALSFFKHKTLTLNSSKEIC